MSLKAIISIAGAVGAGGGVATLALWQTGQFGVSNPNISSSVSSGLNTDSLTATQISPNSISPVTKNTIEENCEVVDTIKEDIFSSLGISQRNYTTIFCKNTNSKDSEKPMAENWTGLFSNDLLSIDGESFALKTKFNMETTTVVSEDDDGEEEEYKTTFKGIGFLHSPCVGKWNIESERISEKSVTKVIVEDEYGDDTQKIYLLFPPKN